MTRTDDLPVQREVSRRRVPEWMRFWSDRQGVLDERDGAGGLPGANTTMSPEAGGIVTRVPQGALRRCRWFCS
jgi:hypothetical protein